MDVGIYTIAIVIGFVIARLGVEYTNLRIEIGPVRVHHWMWATLLISIALFREYPEWVWGFLLGIALEGLRRGYWGWRVER